MKGDITSAQLAHLMQGRFTGRARGTYSDDTPERYAKLTASLRRLCREAFACTRNYLSFLDIQNHRESYIVVIYHGIRAESKGRRWHW